MLLRQLVLGHGGEAGHARCGRQQIAAVAVHALVAHVVGSGQLAGGGIDQRAEVHARRLAGAIGQRGNPLDALARTGPALVDQLHKALTAARWRIDLRQFAQRRDAGEPGVQYVFLHRAHPWRQRIHVLQLRLAAVKHAAYPGGQGRIGIGRQAGRQALGVGLREAQAIDQARQRVEGAAALGRERAVHLVQRVLE